MRGSKFSVLLLTGLLLQSVVLARPVYSVNTTVTPSTIYAGDNGFVGVLINNIGSETINDIWVNVTGHSPELIFEETGYHIFRLEGAWHHTASFPFRVADNAGGNVYYVDFEVSFAGYGAERSHVRAFITVDESINIVYHLLSGNELIPGSNEVRLFLENPNNRSINNLFVKLIGTDYFSIVDAERYLGTINSFSNESVNFTLWLDDVSEGVYPLTLVKEYFGVEHNSTLNFRVHGKPDLTYEVVDDYLLEAGGNGSVSLIVRNTGLVDASDVKVSLIAEDPIAVMNPEQYFSVIPANDSVLLTYDYLVSSDVDPGIFPVTLEFDYESSESHELQFEVVGVPDLEIAGVNTDPERTFANSEFTVSVQVENVGSGKARNVKAFLNVSEGIRGVTEFFIGPIDAEDLDSAVFDLIIGDLPEGPSNLGFNLTYSDLDGNNYLLTESLRIYVRRRVDYTFLYVIVMVVLLIVLVYFRKRVFKYIKDFGKMI